MNTRPLGRIAQAVLPLDGDVRICCWYSTLQPTPSGITPVLEPVTSSEYPA
ncbi:MAG: hypothetical protein IV112_20925 [Methyloversatilis discipulorum]|nr:hypothetical protein [Methyloversatilis discipulorum]